MDAHPNIALLRRLYAAMGEGDVATLQELHAPDFRLLVSGTSAISGGFEGVQGAGQQYAESMALTGGQMEMQLRHLIADDELGFALITARARRPDGREITQDLVHEVHLADGRVTLMREWIWDQHADQAFWS